MNQISIRIKILIENVSMLEMYDAKTLFENYIFKKRKVFNFNVKCWNKTKS